MNKKGFTLIELLIVVAIIGILAAIAIPNFLEAQTRSKVARCLADMKTIVTGLEMYAVDYNVYINPYYPIKGPDRPLRNFLLLKTSTGVIYGCGNQLTTPVAYLSSLPFDPFWNPMKNSNGTVVDYATVTYWGQQGKQCSFTEFHGNFADPSLAEYNDKQFDYILQSPGPNGVIYYDALLEHTEVYDPTNGTVSMGDINYFAPYGFVGGGR